ncbi:VCBS domain-containing protein [Vibrio syngnathi]|uniref:Ig domain protein n=1 Tax=Vibrio syngnathi TaxID=3034029 RepID=A0AA34XQ69_9VIBR|nr:VCBS domain-containing protein [Vibrio syngnathi]ARP40156.1 Putative Ig domain protein [Vibrio syngnathi]
MANKKNVEANKKNTETKNKKSNELEQKKPTQKKKLRLHSHLKVNIPLFQSLMMILPSLAKHAAAESIDNSSGAADQVTTNSVTEKDVTDDHTTADSSAVALQEAQTSDSDVNATLSASHTPHGSSSHLVPSHHLSTLSHPQVHYIPSVSMPTISSGSNGQPTHSNAPTTPALPVTFMPEVIKGTYGELHVDANGQYTFVLNPNSPQYILLNQHQPGTDHFALHLSNGSSIIVQIPVTGKQDTPSISGDLTGVVTEDHNIDSQGLLHANGKIDVIDPDQNESSVTPEVIAGKYGSLTIDADGHWQYQVDNSLSNVQALTGATSLHESFTIHTKDGTPQTIDMTIGGNDDNAIITGVDAGTVTEDLTMQVQGQLSVTDFDLGEEHFQASQVTSNFGTLSITKDGEWTYNLDNNNPVVQGLSQGSTATDIVTVYSADGTAHQVTVTINGTNDAPVLTVQTQSVIEDGSALKGQMQATDVDDNTHLSFEIANPVDGLTFNADGSYSFDPSNAAYQHIAAGQDQTITIPVTVKDEVNATSTQNLTITVHGTNDAPTLAVTNLAAKEDGAAVKGQASFTDVDSGDVHTYSVSSMAAGEGTVSINPQTGEYTFTPGSDFQSLAEGATKDVTFDVTVTDGHGGTATQTVTVMVTGTNDGPVLNTITAATATEGDATATTGTITSTDTDMGDSAAYSTTATVAGFSLNADGSYTFDPSNAAYNGLAEGDTQKITIPITVTDGSGGTDQKDLVITVTGTNDKPVLDSITAQSTTEDGSKVSGTITSTDVDAHETAAYTAPTTDGFSLDPTTGAYTFDPSHAAYQHLAAGQDQTVTIPVTVTDQNGGTDTKNLVITVHGTADSAVIAGTNTGSTTEETQLQASGTLTITDKDAGQDHFQSGDIATAHGTLHLKADGSWIYDLDNTNPSVQSLGTGKAGTTSSLTDTIEVKGADGTTHHITVTVNGTNDGPVLNTISAATATEGDTTAITGTITSTDTDTGDSAAYTTTATVAGFSLKADGSYTFDPTDAAYNGLADGDTQKITIPVTVTDGSGATQTKNLEITVTGTNDKPVLGAITAQSATEDGATVTGTITSSDVDAHETAAYTAPNIDGFSLDPTTGAYTFDPSHSAYQHLAAGQDQTVTIPVTVTDKSGATDTNNLLITVHGTNDAAVIGGQDTGSLDEFGSHGSAYADLTNKSPDHHQANSSNLFNEVLSVSGDLSISDPDSGEAAFQNLNGGTTQFNGQYGHLVISEQGHWNYQVNVGNSSSGRTIDALGEGQEITDTIAIHAKDGTSHDIVVTIHGDNDKPYCSSEVQLSSGKEDTTQVLTLTQLLQNTVDVDANDAGLLTIENLHANHGTIAINTDGTFTFTPEKDYNGQVQFTYDVKDAHGGVTHTGATTSLVAVNDNALITGVDTGNVTEDGRTYSGFLTNMLHTTGQLTITDPDAGEAGFDFRSFISSSTNPEWAPYQSQLGGKLSINPNGEWEYVVDNTKPEIQALGDGETLKDSVIIHSKDGTEHTIEVTIHGTNDSPVVSAATLLPAGTEDTDITLTSAQLLTNATDVDHNDIGQLSVANLTADHGSIITNPDGTFSFTPDKDYNGDVQFTYDVKDAHGGVTHTGASTSLSAVDDISVISGDTSAAVNEGNIGETVTATGTLSISDVDKADNPDFPDVASTATTYGHITMHNGQWTYTLDESKVQQLDPDEAAVVDHHTFTASDGSTQIVDIIIKGTNDKPIIESAHAAPAGASSTLKLQDVDIIEHPTGANIDVATTNADNVARWGSDITGVPAGVKLVGLYKPGSGHNYITSPATTSTAHSGAGGFSRVDNHDWWAHNGIPDTVNTGSGGASGHGNAWTGGIVVFEDASGHQTIGIVNRVCTGGAGEVDYLYYHSYQNLHVGSTTYSGTATAGETVNVMDGTHQIASVVADSNGHWEVAASQLGDGQHTLHVENSAGEHSAETVFQVSGHTVANITPAGLNPELKEDSSQTTIDGELRTTDVDHGDTATITAQTDHATRYGHFSIDANGQYHYTVDNSNQDVNHLGVNQTLTEIIPVTSVSTDGTSVTTNVTITIQGSVDKPILNATAPDGQQGTSMALNLDVAATDTGGDHEDLLIKISGLPDAATLNHGTHDTIAKMWVLHQSDLAGLELNLHDAHFHGDLHFNVTATASAGGESKSTTQAVSLFVNAPPELSSAVTGNKAEDSGMGAINLLAGATDADTGDTLSINHLEYQLGSNAKTSAIPSYLTLGKDGHTLVINANAPEFQHLGAGDSQTITVTYNVNDTHGGTVQQTATVTIAGTNDSAVITGQATGSVVEDNPAQATGTLAVTDTDDNQSHFTAATITGTYGSLTIDKQGTWHYSLSTSGTSGDKVQALADGQKVTDTLQIQSADGTVHNINIAVTGANDQPTITVQTLNATEDSDYTFTEANFGFTDTDSGETLDHITITALPDATQGELLLNGVAVGANQQIDHADIAHLTFKPVANFNGDVHLSYTVNDGHTDSAPATTTLSVANVNDLPTVVTTTQNTQEDTDIIISKAQLLSGANDIDSGDVLDINSVVVNGGHGTVTDNGDGTWTLHPDSNFKGDITLDYKVNDGHADVDNHMTVNVTTVTDKANINLTSSVQQEIITTGAAGRIQIDDIQAAAPLTEFTLEMTVIGKAVADTGATTGPVVVNMGHGSSTNMLSLWNPGNMKIGGAGDVATGINLGDGNSHRVTLTWDSASGDLKIFDNGVLAATAANFHKGGSLPADMYMVLGSKANGGIASPTWNAGEHYEGSIFNTAIASHALTPAQVALGPLASQLNEHTGLLADVRSVSGSIQDTTGAHHLAENGVGHELHTVDTSIGVPPAGSLVNLHPQVSSPDSADTVTGITLHGLVKDTVLSDGTHSHTITGINDTVDIKDWDLDHMTAQLPPAVTRNMNIGITATTEGPDGQTAVITEYTGLKLDPTRPIPNAIISGDDTNSVTEDNHASGGYITSDEHILSIQDGDTGDNRFLASGEKEGSTATSGAWVAGDKGLGEFKLDANGHWLYRVDNNGSNIQELKTGETLTETLTVYSHDGTPHELTATINGTDDIPVITSQALTTQEDTGHTFTAAEFGFSDVDKGDILASITLSTLPSAAQGTLLLDGHAVTQNQQIDATDVGKLVFTPAQDFNSSASFTYTVSDGRNNSQTGTATINVSAVNDAAVIGGVATGSVTDQTGLSATGQLTVTDVDTGESNFQAATGLKGTHGTLDIGADGAWTYTLNPGDRLVDALSMTMKTTDHVTVTTTDGTTKVLDITIHGTNDAPTVTAVALHGTEDNDYTFTATDFGFKDVDFGSALHHVTITSLPNPFEGQFLLDGIAVNSNQQIAASDLGKLVFTPAANFNGDVHFKYTVNDGTVDSTEATGTLNLADVADKAEFKGDISATLNEGNIGDNVSAHGTLNIVDVDTGQTPTIADFHNLDGANAYGHFSMVNNQWTYEIDQTKVQHLNPHESVQDKITVTASDGTTQEIVVNIKGTNDAPTISGILSGGLHDDQSAITGTPNQGNVAISDPDHLGSIQSLTVAGLAIPHDGSSVAISAPTGYLSLTYTSGTLHWQMHAGDVAKSGLTVLNAADTSAHFDAVAVASVNALHKGDSPISFGQFAVVATDSDGATTSKSLNLNWQGTDSSPVVHDIDQFAPASTSEFVLTPAMLQGQFSDADGDTIDHLNLVSGHANVYKVENGKYITFDGTHNEISMDDIKAGLIHMDRGVDTSFSFTATDSGGQTSAAANFHLDIDHKPIITLNGLNPGVSHDAAQIAPQLQMTEDQGGNYQTVLNLGIFDPDATFTGSAHQDDRPEITSVVIGDGASAVTATHDASGWHATTAMGTYTWDNDFKGHFTLNNSASSVQQLGAGESALEKITIASVTHSSLPHSNGVTSEQVFHLEIKGTNDAPVIHHIDDINQHDSSDGTSIHVVLPTNAFTDVDHSDTLSLSATLGDGSALPSWLKFDAATGTLSGKAPHSADGDFDIKVTATDLAGAQASHDFHLTVTDMTGDVKEDGRATGVDYSVNGQLETHMVSGGVNQSIVWHEHQDGTDASPNHMQGTYGFLQISTGGTWIYHVDHDGDAHYSNSAINALKGGEVVQETFNIFGYVNGHLVKTDTITVNVEGTNDAATINGVVHSTSSGSLIEDDATSTITGSLTLADADHGENLFTADPHIAGTYGHVALAADGSWTYQLDNNLAATDALNTGDHVKDTIIIKSPDGTADHTIEVNITGHSDTNPIASPAPPPPPPVQHDEPEPIIETADITIQVSDEGVDPTTPVFGAAAYLHALGIQLPDSSQDVITDHDALPNDMDIVFAQDDVSTALEAGMDGDLADTLTHQNEDNHHDQQQDDDHHQHHLDVDGLPDIDPNS